MELPLIVGEYVLSTIELAGKDPDKHGNRSQLR